MAKHKVLVVDDSALMRRLLSAVLVADGFEVVTASNGEDGVERLLEVQPDVVTLDINMPKMDGLTALSLMMAARPTPVVMVSSLTERGALATLEALALGAVDYIEKPGGTISLSIDEIAQSLCKKVRAAAVARPRKVVAAQKSVASRMAPRAAPAVAQAPAASMKLASSTMPVVIVGVSTGGPRTLEDILPLLPANFPAAVLIAQHMPANFTYSFAQRMGRLCALPVHEVDVVMPLQAGHIYIAKGSADMVVQRKLGRLVAVPCAEAEQYPWHPSVDRLVESAMQTLPAKQIIGVQLTGMGNDGAESMARLYGAGGKTIAESQSTAVVFGMPHELIQRRGATVVLPAHSVAQQLRAWMHS